MELNDYQKQAMSTCMETSHNFTYMFDNLVAEVGEFASKVAKMKRKGEAKIVDDQLVIKEDLRYAKRLELEKEAGDILWQTAGLCDVLDWDLEDVARMNLNKLQARKKNGTIDGSGDGVTKEERSK